jgi:hypothetical protein
MSRTEQPNRPQTEASAEALLESRERDIHFLITRLASNPIDAFPRSAAERNLKKPPLRRLESKSVLAGGCRG